MTNGLKLFWPNEVESVLAGLDQAARGRCAEYHAALEDVATALGIRGPTAVICNFPAVPIVIDSGTTK